MLIYNLILNTEMWEEMYCLQEELKKIRFLFKAKGRNTNYNQPNGIFPK